MFIDYTKFINIYLVTSMSFNCWIIGSSDAIALAHHGTRCPITATLHIILGDRRNVDIMRVMEVSKEKETFRLFSLAMVSYGYFGDLLQSSEKLR